MGTHILEIPDWCFLGRQIYWSDEATTGWKWVRETIVAFGYDGFFHQSRNCPMYYTRFSEWGKTVKPYNHGDPDIK